MKTARYCWLLLGCLALGGCEVAMPLGDPEAAAEDSVKARDRETEEWVAKGEVAEAREWLKDTTTHKLWKGDRQEIAKLVEDLYAAGAPQVYAVGTSKVGDTQIEMVAMFMARLPADPATRARLFQKQTEFWWSYITEPDEEEIRELCDTDRGQQYLLFNFDL